jgi:serine/threonine protein kinase
MIANKYDLISKIGSGAFGSIYKGQNVRTGEPVAIKVEPLKHETNLLKNEARIYQYLKGGVGIPQVKWYGKDKAEKASFAEAFEICEYGTQPSETQIRQLFPLLQKN